MSGHGHVVPNKSGVKARCGGPAICSECAKELAQATASTTAAMQTSSDILNADSSKPIVSMPTRVLQLLLAEITELRRDAAIVKAERERACGPESDLAADILAELVRARTKFPGKNVTFAALVEEVGELATATFEESSERVRKEAVQVAVMAMRMVLDGDHTFDSWRSAKGLDALASPLPSNEQVRS